MGKKSGLSADSDTTREDSIAAFKEQYDSCYFILKTNWKLFLLVFFAFSISCTVIAVTFVVLRTPLSEYENRIAIINNLYKSMVIFQKSLIEIQTDYFLLEPLQTASSNLL